MEGEPVYLSLPQFLFPEKKNEKEEEEERNKKIFF